jgi:serine O-acetyltransferase
MASSDLRLSWSTFQRLVRMDQYRFDGSTGAGSRFRLYASDPGFRITYLMRLCRFLRYQPATRWGIYHVALSSYRHWSLLLGVYIDFTTQIGGGLFIPHPCAIVVNPRCIIGENCNLAQGVTLGLKSRNPNSGCPTIGDRVYIGPNAVIIGSIRVGHDSAVGANCVVTHDVEDHSVVAGVPGRKISSRGSEGYINYTLNFPSPSAQR